MANDKNVEQLSDDELEVLAARRRTIRAKADILVAEDVVIVDKISAQLADAEVNDAATATVAQLQQLLDARTAHMNGRKGALVAAQRALEHVEAERQRRREVNARGIAEGARAALHDYARSVTDEVKIAAETITTMIRELRVRAQACRDADYDLRLTTGTTARPEVLRFLDPYSEDITLEEVAPGTSEVTRTLERFTNGDLNAQLNQRLAAEARARARA